MLFLGTCLKLVAVARLLLLSALPARHLDVDCLAVLAGDVLTLLVTHLQSTFIKNKRRDKFSY